MATRWLRTRIVLQEVSSGVHHEGKENVNPMLGDELEIPVQESHILVRCQPRRHPRIPLRDITHLFPGNVSLSSTLNVLYFLTCVRVPLFSQISARVLILRLLVETGSLLR